MREHNTTLILLVGILGLGAILTVLSLAANGPIAVLAGTPTPVMRENSPLEQEPSQESELNSSLPPRLTGTPEGSTPRLARPGVLVVDGTEIYPGSEIPASDHTGGAASIDDFVVVKDPDFNVLKRARAVGGGSPAGPYSKITIALYVTNTGKPALVRWIITLSSKSDVREGLDCSDYQLQNEWAHTQFMDTDRWFHGEVVVNAGPIEFLSDVARLADCHAIELEITRVKEAR